MSKELAKQEAAPPAFMRNDAAKAAADMDVSLRPFIHLCQSKSPEVEREEIAKAGDFYVRNIDINLGPTFKAVLLAHQLRWVRWGAKGTEDEGKVLWQAPDGKVPQGLLHECQWRSNPEGGNDLPPLANETHVMALVVLNDAGEVDEEIGLIYANMDRTAAKVAKGVLKVLAAENRKGWHPAAVVFKFSSQKVTGGKFVYMAWDVSKSGHITDESTYSTLKEMYERAQAEKARAAEGAVQAASDEVRGREVIAVAQVHQAFSAQEASDAEIDSYATSFPSDGEEDPPF